MMRHSLDLARRGLGKTAPNPLVAGRGEEVIAPATALRAIGFADALRAIAHRSHHTVLVELTFI
jgi:hypothetical protein